PRNGSGNSQFRAAPPVVRRIGMDRRATRPTWSDNLAHAEMMQARKWLSQIPRPAQYYGIDLRRSETRLGSGRFLSTAFRPRRCCLTAPGSRAKPVLGPKGKRPVRAPDMTPGRPLL